MIGEQPLCNNFSVSSAIELNGIDFLFDNVCSVLNYGYIVFGDLECSIMSRQHADKNACVFG